MMLISLAILCSCTKAISPDEREALSFVTEYDDWSQELSRHGERIATMVLQIARGDEVRVEKVESARSFFRRMVASKIDEYEKCSLPGIPELQVYRRKVIEYLEWQKGPVADRMSNWILIATDTALDPEERRLKFVDDVKPLAEQEERRKLEIAKAEEQLRLAIRN